MSTVIWDINVREREFKGGEVWEEHGEVSPTLIKLILEENPADMRILDVGCGSGRLTFAVGSCGASEVIGIDWKGEEIERARAYVEKNRVKNVRLIMADAERIEYRQVAGGRVDMVVANLCMSDAILGRSGQALEEGSAIIFSAFHIDQWRETGVISRFAYSQEGMEISLREAGLSPEYLGLEREVVRVGSKAEFVEAYFARSSLRERWERDGRWARLMRYFDAGGRQFTNKCHIIAKARKT